jgi:hypothetical protein
MQNYENYKLKVHFCIFTSLHMLNLHVFKLATNPWPSLQVYTFASLQVYKFSSLQNNFFTDYTLIITILQFHKLQLHACKYEKLPNYQITKLQITNYKIYNYQNYKFCKCIFAYLQVNAHAQFACF